MTLSLGIDIGTSGIRAATVNSTGKVLSTSQQQHLPQNSNKIDPELINDSCLLYEIPMACAVLQNNKVKKINKKNFFI